MKDYMLRGIDFEAASNGVIATCRFKLKPDVESKMQKAAKGGCIDYDTRYHDEKVVFEGFDAGEVSDFLMGTMNEFKNSKAGKTDGD